MVADSLCFLQTVRSKKHYTYEDYENTMRPNCEILRPANLDLPKLIEQRQEFIVPRRQTDPVEQDDIVRIEPFEILSVDKVNYLIDYCYWFTYKVISLNYYNDRRYPWFVNIPKSVITANIPTYSYQRVICILSQLGVIEVNERYGYFDNVYSKSYRINKKYFGVELVPYQVTNKTLIKNLVSAKRIEKNSYAYNVLLSPGATDSIDLQDRNFFRVQDESLRRLELDYVSMTDVIEGIDDIYDYNRALIASLNYQYKSISITSKSQKVVHSLQNLPRWMRSHLIHTRDLYIYDYSASATLHLIKMLDLIIKGYHCKALPNETDFRSITYRNDIDRFTDIECYYELSSCVTTGAKPAKTIHNRIVDNVDKLERETAMLKQLITSDKFYSFLINNGIGVNKDEVKTVWITGFLYRSKNTGSRKIESLFPAVASLLKWFDRVKKSSGETLASILQKSESYLVNQVVIERISRNAICLNLFDGIITDIDIGDIIKEESFFYFGFNPVVKIEPVNNIVFGVQGCKLGQGDHYTYIDYRTTPHLCNDLGGQICTPPVSGRLMRGKAKVFNKKMSTITRITDAIEDLKRTSQVITKQSIATASGISIDSVKRYWKPYKEQIERYNMKLREISEREPDALCAIRAQNRKCSHVRKPLDRDFIKQEVNGDEEEGNNKRIGMLSEG